MKFIFEVHLKPGHTVAEYAAAWIRASTIIQTAPGARGTRLHRKIGHPEVLMAIATWESKQHRDARDEFLKPDAAMRAVLNEHTAIADFKVIGEYEEAQWVIEPPAC